MRRLGSGLALSFAAALTLTAQDLKEFEKRVTEFTLANGLHFIVAERRDAPVVSFHTYIRAGSAEDPGGQTGMTHLLEHMAFKGTDTIGSKDWAAEKKALEAIEEAYDRLETERNKPKEDVGKLGAAQILLNRTISAARSLVRPGEFRRILEENGAVGITAVAGPDATEFTCSLPSNRLELWFLMESQRLQRPVLREFYNERESLQDEYRERVETLPQGRLTQVLLSTALAAHPYRNPSLGWPSDFANLRMRDAKDFLDRYYVAGNIRIAIVGDVDPAEARKLAERYFGPMPARPLPPLVHTQEPVQTGPKSVAVEAPGQPMMMVAYHRPEQSEPDDAVLDVIQLILGGRGGWLFKTLVEEKKIAAGTQSVSTFPGGRYANLFTIMVVTAPGRSIEDTQKAVDELVARLVNQGVDADSLTRAKAQLRATILGRLGSNAGLGIFLASYQGAYGDWRRMFQNFEEINRVADVDVQRVARKYFTVANRTVAFTVPPRPGAAARPEEGVGR